MGKEEVSECTIIVLKDMLRRSLWHMNMDKQSSPPTKRETQEFADEVRAVLKGD